MLFAVHGGGLELRREGGETRLSGRFPYGRETVLRKGDRHGRELREIIAPRAFRSRIEAGEDIHLLAGHDMNRPVASTRAGTLNLREDDSNLYVEARIDPEVAGVSYVADLLATVRAGLAAGLSPGFQLADDERAELIEAQAKSVLRTVQRAELFEVSIVTRPAYPDAQVEARNWRPPVLPAELPAGRVFKRWRL